VFYSCLVLGIWPLQQWRRPVAPLSSCSWCDELTVVVVDRSSSCSFGARIKNATCHTGCEAARRRAKAFLEAESEHEHKRSLFIAQETSFTSHFRCLINSHTFKVAIKCKSKQEASNHGCGKASTYRIYDSQRDRHVK
jgi:hypothetical protein